MAPGTPVEDAGFASARRIWRTFCAESTTTAEDPRVRRDWHRGRPFYALCIHRVSMPEVLERAAAIQRALSPWLIPWPLNDLHVTLGIAGFPSESAVADDDVCHQTLLAQAKAIGGQRRPQQVRVHGACSFLAAPFLFVTGDFDPLRGILDPPARALHIEHFVPHITLGQWKQRYPTPPLAHAMSPFVDAPPIAIAPHAVELVEFEAKEPRSPLVTRNVIQLLD